MREQVTRDEGERRCGPARRRLEAVAKPGRPRHSRSRRAVELASLELSGRAPEERSEVAAVSAAPLLSGPSPPSRRLPRRLARVDPAALLTRTSVERGRTCAPLQPEPISSARVPSRRLGAERAVSPASISTDGRPQRSRQLRAKRRSQRLRLRASSIVSRCVARAHTGEKRVAPLPCRVRSPPRRLDRVRHAHTLCFTLKLRALREECQSSSTSGCEADTLARTEAASSRSSPRLGPGPPNWSSAGTAGCLRQSRVTRRQTRHAPSRRDLAGPGAACDT